MNLQLVKLGASSVSKETGANLWQAVIPVTDGVNDVDSLGGIDPIQALGLLAQPAAADESGHAEALTVSDVGGLTAAALGARDTRMAKIAGAMKPGDTVLCSTGPSMAAQVMLKESKRQVVLATKNAKGETQALVLDGENEKLQIAVNGCMLECADGGWTITDKTGKAGIMIRDGQVNIFGQIVLGGLTANPALSIMLGPVVGSPGGATSAPMFAAKGVFVGL